MNILTLAQRAYIAGVVDGEGYVGIGRQVHNDRRHPNYAINCEVYNTNLRLLNWIKQITNIGVIEPSSKVKAVHKQSYTWRLRIDEVPELLKAIFEFLVIKQEQAGLVLEFITTLRHDITRNPLTQDEAITKDLIWRELAELNKKGI